MQIHLPSWDELAQIVPGDLLDEVDQLLVQYESAWQFGKPDRSKYLEQCPVENAIEWLGKELDHIDDHYLGMHANATGGRLNHIGRFKIVEEIGSGSEGVILKAIDFATDELVAIKIPRLPWRVQNSQERLQSESDILKSLDHPNIVKFVDSGFVDGYWFVATEWIDGGTLRSAINEVQIPVEQCLDIAIQVANALEHGHSLGIVHRDIKPGNIMLRSTEDMQTEVKVLDYGLARLCSAETLSETETFLTGTLDYIAPERACGISDARSDIFSLGIVLIKMLRTSYASSNLVPKPIRDIFRKATHASAEKRYQTAGQFRDELDQVAQQIQLGIVPKTRPKPRLKTTAALLLAICFLFGLLMSPRGIPVASVAPPQFPSPQDTPYSGFFDDAGRARVYLQTDPPGAKLSIFSLNNLRGEPQIEDEIYLGVSPINAWIKPDDYFVVVSWPDGNHHEVLRRVPNQKTQGVLPFFHLDMFDRHVRGIQLKTVHAPQSVLAGMISSDGIWLDPAPQLFATSQPKNRELKRPEMYSNNGYRVTVSMLEAASKLEEQGKRLPFLSELRAFVGNTVQLEIDEWTATLVDKNEIVGENNEIFTQSSEYYVASRQSLGIVRPENDFSKDVGLGYRGVRAKLPFTAAAVSSPRSRGPQPVSTALARSNTARR